MDLDDFPQKILPGLIVWFYERDRQVLAADPEASRRMVKTALRKGDGYQLFCNVLENLDG